MSFKIDKLFEPQDMAKNGLITLLGDTNEFGLYFNPFNRNCYLKNLQTEGSIWATWLARNVAMPSQQEIMPGAELPIDSEAPTNFGYCAIMWNLSFTSSINIWSATYNSTCVSLVPHKDDNQGVLIIGNVDLNPNPINKKR